MSFTTFRRAIVAGLIFPAALAAQTPFEGAVTMSLSSPRGSQEITYLIKGDKIRLDMPAQGGMSGFLLRDNDATTTYIVMPAQKMYMDMSAMQAMMPGQKAAKTPDIKPTGQKETIAGYECEHVIVTDDEGQVDVCLAKGLGSFMGMSSPMGGRGGPSATPRSLERLGANLFPLKVQRVGGEAIMQVTKIEKKPLDASMFALPSDFTKMEFPMRGRP